MTRQRTNMNVLFIIANEINTLNKENVCIQIASKATASDMQQTRASKTKNQRQMKNKRMVEPIFGKMQQKESGSQSPDIRED